MPSTKKRAASLELHLHQQFRCHRNEESSSETPQVSFGLFCFSDKNDQKISGRSSELLKNSSCSKDQDADNVLAVEQVKSFVTVTWRR